MREIVLAVQNLTKRYKRGLFQKSIEALSSVSFKVHAGEVTGFLGANGAGKTTTLKCILDLAFADEGEVFYFGEKGLSSQSKTRIGFLPERPYFYEYLTGREFLHFYGQLSQIPRKIIRERTDELLKKVGLEHAADRALRSYSKGMLQRIGIAQALIHQPQLIILDEPMTGLDPDGRFEIREIIRSAAASGTAVFFSSHLLPDAETLCDRLIILKQGRLVYEGQTGSLLQAVQSGNLIFYKPTGQLSPQTLVVPSHEDLQLAIDKLRGQSHQILEIRPDRLSLEEAFMKIAFDSKAQL
jgi:ABC-2 type transport system ATP-binding protein